MSEKKINVLRICKEALKYLFSFLIVYSTMAQDKKDVVFLFQEQDSTVYKEGNIYHLDGLYFKETDKSVLEKEKLHKLKNEIISIDNFKREEEKQTHPFYDRNYSYYLLIKKCSSIIAVERMVVIIEDEIED